MNDDLTVAGFWRRPSSSRLDLQGYGEPLLTSLESRMPRPIVETDPAVAITSLRTSAAGIHSGDPACAFPDRGATEWQLVDAEVTLWNTATVLVTTTYSVTKPAEMTWTDFGNLVAETRGPARDDLRTWSDEVVAPFSALAENRGWSSDLAGDASSEFWSDPLWTYHSFIVEAPRADGERAATIAEGLVEDGSNVACDDATARIGLSAAFVSSRPDHPSSARLLDLVAVHTACWSAATTLDSFVADELLTFGLTEQSSGRLDHKTDRLLRLADKVRFFLAIVEGAPPHLQHDDRDLWDHLDEEWKSKEHRAALSRNLDDIRTLHSDLTDQVSARGLRRLNTWAMVIAIAGGVASVVTVWGFFDDAGTKGRFLVLLSLALVVAIIAAVMKRPRP